MERVVLITGSTRGIGLALATFFYHQGDSIIIHGRTRETVTKALTLFDDKKRVASFCGDIGKSGIAERLVKETVENFGKIDIVINNAGIVRDRISYKMTDEEWTEVIDSHLFGTFSTCRTVIPYMREQGGQIINMTSLAGIEGQAGQVNYASAKAGIIGLTYTLAEELARFQISVNAISPTALTDMTKPYVEAANKLKENVDYWQIGEPEDICPLVDYLCSEKGKLITGRVFSVNGNKIGCYQKPEHRTVTLSQNETMEEQISRIVNG
ncbi:SDR family NAD(P)-dependent oxidoreductase [Anaerobacillus sp. MEB173]|uniref:SDR family NAD(P)-dependent oxidoreductase n=1 Tax=Anaerobacillus sp. MEB173 TaxID=3383345 RepID=UPI003F8D90A8